MKKYYFATGHGSRCKQFEEASGASSIMFPESSWFVSLGQIPEGSNEVRLRTGTESLYIMDSWEETQEKFLRKHQLEIVSKSRDTITCKYTGKKKSKVIGQNGRIVKFISSMVGARVNIL